MKITWAPQCLWGEKETRSRQSAHRCCGGPAAVGPAQGAPRDGHAGAALGSPAAAGQRPRTGSPSRGRPRKRDGCRHEGPVWDRAPERHRPSVPGWAGQGRAAPGGTGRGALPTRPRPGPRGVAGTAGQPRRPPPPRPPALARGGTAARGSCSGPRLPVRPGSFTGSPAPPLPPSPVMAEDSESAASQQSLELDDQDTCGIDGDNEEETEHAKG